MDQIDHAILDVLHQDARTSLKELGERVGLSSPSVSERVRRLEERGVIRAFTLEVEPRALGYQLQAIVRIRPLPGQMAAVEQLIRDTLEFCECDKVTGDDCYVARLYVRSIEQLDSVLERIADKAQTHTAVVKSQIIRRRSPPLVLQGG